MQKKKKQEKSLQQRATPTNCNWKKPMHAQQ